MAERKKEKTIRSTLPKYKALLHTKLPSFTLLDIGSMNGGKGAFVFPQTPHEEGGSL